MKRVVSIAEARHSFAELVHEAESGTPIEVTRRGKTVAVVLSIGDFERLSGHAGSFAPALEAFRAGLRDGDLRGLHDAFADVRDRSVGREVGL